jgi:tetratricopeptide (TPR) repeat protein
MAVSPLLRFGPFTFEPHTGALWRETERLPLQPQDAAVLHSLLQQAGRVVRTEVLLDAVWPDTSVSETWLTNRINRLRQLLGDDPKRPQYIETRPGQGYRFLGLPLGREVGTEEMPRPGRPAVGLADDTFIGREPELATLHTALADATAGHGRIVLLAGEPGVGKTRLAQELAAYARQHGALVLVGRCYEGEGAPPFWPWVQMLRTYVMDCDPGRLRQEMGLGAADIAQVVPEVREQLPDLTAVPGVESEQARFRLFDSVTLFFQAAARRQVQVLIVDDLHWADIPSLLLLQFVAREVGEARVLVLGTYRDLGLPRGHALLQALGEIVRVPGSQTLALRGLSEPEVARFLERRGFQPFAPLVTAVYQATEGNPFFLTEVVRLLADEQDHAAIRSPQSTMAIPQGVRAAVERRLQALSAECQQVLTLAAVRGREFDVAALESAGTMLRPALTGERLLEVLEEAVAARIIAEIPQAVGRYSFAHALIRETLYAELSAARRVRLHHQIGGVLESLYETTPEPHPSTSAGQALAELAYHFFQAAHGGSDVDKAVSYATQAGALAMAMLAYEAAASQYERALRALSLHASLDEWQACELLLVLGEAYRKAGDVTQAQEVFLRAAELAHQLRVRAASPHAAMLLARAAVGFGGDWSGRFGICDRRLVELLESALDALEASDSVVRVRVMSQLAMALVVSHHQERGVVLSQHAVEMARRLNDRTALAVALHSRHWLLWARGSLEERLAVATEIVWLADAEGDHELVFHGRVWRLIDLLESGEMTMLDEELAAFVQLTVALRQPFYQWWVAVFQAMLASLAGRFGEAEHLAHRAAGLGQRVQDHTSVQSVLFTQLWIIRQEQGRVQDLQALQPGGTYFALQYPTAPGWQITPAFLASVLGQEAEARRAFEILAADDFVGLGWDASWLSGIMMLSHVCVFLGDVRRAAILYTLLHPYAGRNVVSGRSLKACYGPVSHYLGLLATLLARWDEAEPHFNDALALSAKMGARPWEAHTQHDYAGMLLARRRPGDQEKAQALLALALATAQELGMTGLQAHVHRLQSPVPGAASRPQERAVSLPPASPQDAPAHVASLEAPSVQHIFRHEGAYWTLAYQGQRCRLKEAKGLHYLATLLRSPGREFHVADLAALSPLPPARSGARPPTIHRPETLAVQHLRVTGLGDAGAQLDARARADYKRRLEDLQAVLDEAERFSDPARAATARAEIDFLTAHLATAYGMGRRARKGADTNEKVRKAVTKCLRTSLASIQQAHLPLWRHLHTALKTGTFCSYTPEPPITWEV